MELVYASIATLGMFGIVLIVSVLIYGVIEEKNIYKSNNSTTRICVIWKYIFIAVLLLLCFVITYIYAYLMLGLGDSAKSLNEYTLEGGEGIIALFKEIVSNARIWLSSFYAGLMILLITGYILLDTVFSLILKNAYNNADINKRIDEIAEKIEDIDKNKKIKQNKKFL